MDKPIGQTAYEAFRSYAEEDKATLPEWADLDVSLWSAWECAARAVECAILTRMLRAPD